MKLKQENYNDRRSWKYEDNGGKNPRLRDRRKNRHFERDLKRLGGDPMALVTH